MENSIIFDKLSSLSEISKTQLAKILKSIPGPKDLTLEPQIIKPLEKICDINWLKYNGINKIYKLESKAIQSKVTQFFMVYTNVKTFQATMELIMSHTSQSEANKLRNHYHIICIPKYLYAFDSLLEENGLTGIVRLYSLQWLPIHVDEGVTSLEIPCIYKQLYVNHDFTLLPCFAKSLWQLFLVFGQPNFSLLFGQFSNVAMTQFKEYCTQGPCSSKSEFTGLVVMDRSLDYPSALLSPCTYTALLNEVYSVRCGHCKHEQVNTDKYDEQYNRVVHKQSVNFSLNSKKDEIYNRIKNMYFTEVTVALSDLTKELRSEGQHSKEMALDEIKKYVETKLKSLTLKKKLVTNHLNVAETIITTFSHKFERLNEIESNLMQNKNKSDNFRLLEEYLQTESDKYSSLALLMLMAVTQKVTETELKSFLDKYFLEFGYKLGFVYRNLINGNILEFSSKLKLPNVLQNNNFYTNASKLKLISTNPSKINLKVPNCCSYVFGGLYLPLIAQISSILLSGCPIDDLKSKLDAIAPLQIDGTFNIRANKKVLLVVIIGGITYSEIAALNLLEKLTGTTIITLSESVISKKDVVDAYINLL